MGAAKKYRITTKALPRQCGKDDILKSAKGSLEDLQVDKVCLRRLVTWDEVYGTNALLLGGSLPPPSSRHQHAYRRDLGSYSGVISARAF